MHKRQPEHGNLCFICEVSIVGGPGATGKTSYLISAAVALASGVPVLGQRVYKRRRVLLIVLEEHVDEVLLKLRASLKLLRQRFTLPDDTEDYITVFGSGELEGLTLTTVDPITHREKVNKAGLDCLSAEIKRSGAEVVFIDPLSMLLPNSMNDNGISYQAIQGVKQIGADLKCAIILSAHTRKMAPGGARGAAGVEDVMGAAAISNSARVVQTLGRVDVADLATLGVPYGREGNIREVADQKTNFAPLAARTFIEIVGVRMNNATPPDYPDDDWVGVAVEFMPQVGGRAMPTLALRSVVEQLARGSSSGAPYSPAKQGGRHYGQDLAQALVPHFPGATPAKLSEAAKEAYQEALNKGWIDEVDTKVGRNTRKGIRVKWSSTPWANDPRPGGAYHE